MPENNKKDTSNEEGIVFEEVKTNEKKHKLINYKYSPEDEIGVGGLKTYISLVEIINEKYGIT